jgi:hypothetical protein
MDLKELTVDQHSDGTWVVIRPIIVASGFATSVDAWAWIDRYDEEHRRWTDTAQRIGNAFARAR